MEPPQRTQPISLHDSLSLGEVELGLSSDHRPSIEEVRRLPILLRLLSSSRPLSSIPTFQVPAVSDDAAEDAASDDIIQQAVDRLEDRAALYSAAEGVEVVACHLAPFVCRKLSRLQPLRKNAATGEFDTEDLTIVVANPVLSSRIKRQKLSQAKDLQAGGIEDDEDGAFMSDEDVADQSAAATAVADSNNKRRRVGLERDSFVVGNSEDSQEATVTKTLSELASLVVRSLKSSSKNDDGDGETNTLLLPIEDSILAEARQGSAAVGSVGGAMIASDLGSTVAALMHHAPVFRHRHMASALCRAAVPQAADLIGGMGANCPAAVPCLLRGCIDVCTLAQEGEYRSEKIESTVKKAIRALAALSERESSRVRTVLRQQGILLDLQLDLAIQQDPVAAACLLIERLSQDTRLEEENLQSRRAGDLGRARSDSADRRGDEPRRLSLLYMLEKTPDLLVRTLMCLVGELSSMASEVAASNKRCSGRDCIFLTAYNWVMFRVRFSALYDSTEHGHKSLTSIVPTLIMYVDSVQTSYDEQPTKEAESSLDRLFALAMCATVTTLAQLVVVDDNDRVAGTEKCAAWLWGAFADVGVSLKTSVLFARFALVLKYKDAAALRDVLEGVLLQRAETPNVPIFRRTTALLIRLSATCEWVSERMDFDVDSIIDRGTSAESFVVDQTAMLEFVNLQEGAKLMDIPRVQQVLKNVLEDTDNSVLLLSSSIVPAFIQKVTPLLLKSSEPKVPLVLPLQIEKLALQIDLRQEHYIGKHEAQFLLQFLYAAAFVEGEPMSPFAVSDFRSLPLREILLACSSPSMSDMNAAVRSLRCAVYRLCPEIRIQMYRYTLQVASRHNTSIRSTPVARRTTKALLLRVLQRSMSQPEEDPQGLRAEKAFIRARTQLTDAELFTTVTVALTSKMVHCTYSLLCRDPLVLFKCPLSVWARKGWRRTVLCILAPLLETNDCVVRRVAPLSDTCEELVAARNLLVVRGIVAAIGNSTSSLGAAVVRNIVSKQPSLVGVMLRQGIPESSLDWLVTFVPETMNGTLDAVLSDRSSLTMAERLVAADGVLRIAVAHGHRDAADTKALAYAALAQLIGSFFLVIGPTGVPVSALVSGSGLDATKTARRAMFRMLRCLAKVRGYRTGLRNECLMALQKLAGLVTGENIVSGVPGAVATRQKNLLKEMFDAIVKANNAMGSGM